MREPLRPMPEGGGEPAGSTSSPGSGSEEVRPPAPTGDVCRPCVQEHNGVTTTVPRVYEDPRLSQDRQEVACDEPDVLLDVPMLKVEEIDLEAEKLRAHVALLAELTDRLRLSVGADVNLDKAKLTIKGIEVQALLKVRLDQIRAILEAAALPPISENPEILDGEILQTFNLALEALTQTRPPSIGVSPSPRPS
jgi:hypothetical protein